MGTTACYSATTQPADNWLRACELCAVAYSSLDWEQRLAVKLRYGDELSQEAVAMMLRIIVQRPYNRDRVNTILQTAKRRMLAARVQALSATSRGEQAA